MKLKVMELFSSVTLFCPGTSCTCDNVHGASRRAFARAWRCQTPPPAVAPPLLACRRGFCSGAGVRRLSPSPCG